MSPDLMLDEISKLRVAQPIEPAQPVPLTAGTGADVSTGRDTSANQPPSGRVWFAF